MIKILMIEDDEDYASLLTDFLAQYNLYITNYEDPCLALNANIEEYDLLILDLSLPNMDGLEVCKKVVEKYDIPIIISSARSDLADKIIGLDLGADDYLPKPYAPKEMVARINSLLRRYKKINTQEKVFTLMLCPNEEELTLNGTVINLTPAEFMVAKLLIQNRNLIVSKEDILYNSKIFENGSDGSLAVIINRLRKKLGEEIKIKTIRGMGYKLLS